MGVSGKEGNQSIQGAYSVNIENIFHKKLPFVSIVVISKDRHEELKKAVSSLKQLDYPKESYEIIVVEEGDTQTPIEGVKYIFLPRRNLGLGYARNRGVRNSKGEIIAFTDDDCIHEKNWLTIMVNTLLETGGGGVAGATLGQPRNLIGRCEEIMGYPGGGLKRVIDARGKIVKTNNLSGCNSAYKKSVFEEFKFKEDGFGKLGGDDWWLGHQVSEKYGAYFNPDAILYHKPRGSLSSIVKWFARRRINELLGMEYEFHKKGFTLLLGEIKNLIFIRLLLWICLIIIFGIKGLMTGMIGFILILVITVIRHLPGIIYHNDYRLIFVLPAVRLAMDIGILKAELQYLLPRQKTIDSSLNEYKR